MSVQLKDSKVLLVSSKVANDPACCCGGDACTAGCPYFILKFSGVTLDCGCLGSFPYYYYNVIPGSTGINGVPLVSGVDTPTSPFVKVLRGFSGPYSCAGEQPANFSTVVLCDTPSAGLWRVVLQVDGVALLFLATGSGVLPLNTPIANTLACDNTGNQGHGGTATISCPPGAAGACLGIDGSCGITSAAQCQSYGADYSYQGDGTSCPP